MIRSMFTVRGGILHIHPITGTIRRVVLSPAVLSVSVPAFLSELIYFHGAGSIGIGIMSI
jgi:hypothetical protein